MDNPFSPSLQISAIPISYRLRYVDWIAWLCIVPLIVATYSCWAIAYATLRRPPVPGRDFPNEIDSSLMSISVAIVNFLAEFTVPVIGIAIILQLVLPGTPVVTRCKRAAATLSLLILTIVGLALDPSGAFRWLVFSSS